MQKTNLTNRKIYMVYLNTKYKSNYAYFYFLIIFKR